MTIAEDTQIMDPAPRVQALRRVLDAIDDALNPIVDLSRPYVDGTDSLPSDGRFLLVGNHTQGLMMEVLLTSHFIRKSIGTQVRTLAERGIANAPGPLRDVGAAYGAVIGSPDNATELMRHNQTILVYPGGGREIAKFKGEENTLKWQGRAGFARVAIANNYPIVPVALLGGDDMYEGLLTRDSTVAQRTLAVVEQLTGRKDTPVPLMRGIGPTLIPRPQRMYLRFGTPIDTTAPPKLPTDQWIDTVKQKTQTALEDMIADLLKVRDDDPYRHLNPLAWSRASRPKPFCRPG